MDTEKNIPQEENEQILAAPEQAEDVTDIPAELPAEPAESEEIAAEENAEEAESTEASAEEADESDEEEWEEESEETVRKRIRRKKRRRGALRFWAALFTMILCVLILLCCAMIPFRSVLEQYEAAQSKYVRDAVYEMLFQDPDWALLYDLAGVESTTYEGKSAYVEYMEEKVGDQELTWVQTSTGLSDTQRYLLRCGGETVAAYTLCQEDSGSLFTGWTLESVEVFFTREESVTVMTLPDYTVYVNGIALDESNLTTSVHTAAEQYLPEGIHGYRWVQLEIGGFLVEPDVVILDKNNNPVQTFYSAQSDLYSTDIPVSPEISEEEYAIVADAAEAQAKFAIRAINISQFRQYFDANSQIYTDISTADPFVKSYQKYTIDEDSISVTDFRRYSDDLFSVRVKLSMEIKIKWKTYKTYELDTTYFFTRTGSGAYLVTDSMDVDLTKQIKQVRLTYSYDNTVLLSEMTDTATTKFLTPEIAGADGAAPSAWAKTEADGSLTTVLELQEDGTYRLAEGQSLEAMTLYPVFAEAVDEE